MKDCSKKIASSKVVEELKKLIGNDDVLQTAMFLQAFDENELSSDFIEWYTNRHPKAKVPSIEITVQAHAKAVASEIMQYYYSKHPNVDATVRIADTNDAVVRFGYSSIFEREKGLTHVGTCLLDVFNNIQNTGRELPDDKFKFYLRQAKTAWLNLMFDSLSNKTGKPVTTIRVEYKDAEDKMAYLENAFSKDGLSISDKNKLAVYRELFGTERTTISYINDVLADTRLQDIYGQVKGDIEAETTRLAAEASKEENGDTNPDAVKQDELDLDTYITNLTNHIGVYTSFMTHVGPRIRNYFNTLRKLSSPTIGDFDTSNTYGIAETMDANACSSMLYNNGDFHNIRTMIDSIRRIGERVAGFEAFVKLAYDLENNMDFATEMFTVFAKMKMGKIETVVETGQPIVRISNSRADANSAFTSDLTNDVKTSAIDNDSQVMQNIRVKLTKRVDYIKKNKNNLEQEDIEKLVAELKDELIKLIKSYYPSIQDAAITSYVEINNSDAEGIDNVDIQLNNIANLLVDMKNTITASEATTRGWNSLQATAAEIKAFNENLDSQRKERWVDANEYKSLIDVYSDDYVEPQKASIQSIVAKLLPYSVIDTSLNSRNIYGNNNSDIINSSLLTRLSRMLDDNYKEEIRDASGKIIGYKLRNKTLEAWGLKKLKSKQYKYSNLLLEQTDDNGNVINKGLFKYVDGQLCITDYANELLKIYLFNGSSNIDNGTNIAYSDMTTGDYLPTSFINFFKTENKTEGLKTINLAHYFLRTPSDSPKTFAFRAPRYNTKGLFKLKDETTFNNTVEEIVNDSVHLITFDEFNEKYRNEKATGSNSVKIPDSRAKEYLIPNHNLLINENGAIKEIDNEGQVYVTVLTDAGYTFVLEGDVVKAAKGKALANAKLVGIVGVQVKEQKFLEEVPDDIKNIFRDYYSNKLRKQNIEVNGKTYIKPEEVVDTTHPVYTMIKNQFKQEMLDAAVALNHYFELKQLPDGTFVVQFDGNKPQMKAGVSNTKGYKFYHLDDSGKVLSEKDGEFSLGGKVFHSNKFTLVIEKDGKVDEENYLDKIISTRSDRVEDGSINFLYGGGFRILGTRSEDGSVTVEDVVFGDEQQAKIDEALNKFLQAYKNQAIEKITSYEDFIEGITVNDDNITEFAINQLLMHYNYDEILEGSTKFYLDGQTILKRAKEYQGSGVPYGISDYSADFVDDLSEVENSYLNNGSIEEDVIETYIDEKGKTKTRKKKDEDGNQVTVKRKITDIFDSSELFRGVRQRKGFRAVTIKNTKRTNVPALEQLTKKLMDQGLSEKEARNILYGPETSVKKGGNPVKNFDESTTYRRGGFTDTKVNDAQSYITVQEWVRRIAARGQLQRYLPLIRKLMDPNAVLTAADIKEFIQVQKNFYYDLHYDDRYGIYVPRQIKNAEFVLVPQLIKGTQLEEVYNLMRKANIDQLNTVETSKASNEDVLTLWDNNGDISQERIDNFAQEADNTAQIYSYNCLYTQQETPQHMNASNKAGIQIMKKIIDNLPNDDSALGKLKAEYFRLFGRNIEESFSRLLDEFEIPRDENGNIKLDEAGNIEGINLKVFFNKLKEEMMRTGLDSNLFDYVNIADDATRPDMPPYRNNIITKFESVVQSLFNNGITRQKLPGFHSAQVTNIGWKPLSNNIENVSYSKELRYHPDGKGYIEVLLPLSFLGIDRTSEHYKNMTDAQILEELEKEGLDMVMGYRIPTEGKQSVCNMKVVGFVSDAYGSTIVVPDDWVSQTGSDFDIDSVYGIQFETYKTRTGQVKRIKYIEHPIVYDWFSYVIRYSEEALDRNVSDNIKKAKEEVSKAVTDIYRELERIETKAYHAFTEKQQTTLRRIQESITKDIQKQGLDRKEAYLYRLEHFSKGITAAKNKAKDAVFQKNCEDLISAINNIQDFLLNQNDYFKEKSSDAIKEILDARMETFQKAASKAGLMSYEDFIKPENLEKANSQKARNTRLLEIMQSILSDPKTLEENLSRSNFDDLVAARDEAMNDNVAKERKGRSPYNIFDQIAYQEDAMSGAKLKAFSVTLDTFCSVCNKIQPTLEEPVYIVYNQADYENPQAVLNRFNGGKLPKGKTFAIRHNTYGWSKDNRNVAGKILTAYSSQTTAFILDAIKEGAIPNVNDYTFSTFKTLANIGTDYKCAVSFIMQPGVTEIVKAYNANKSVFATSSGNPIHQAIRNIAKQLNVEADYTTPINAVLLSLNKKYGARFNKMFKQAGDEDIKISLSPEDTKNLPIIVNLLTDRLKDRGKFKSSTPVEEKALFDLGVVLMFNRLHNTANAIGDIARCCNPDRFGAKQTVYATRKVFDDIDNCIYDREKVPDYFTDRNEDGTIKVVKKRRNPVLTVDGKHILASIYPGVDGDTFTTADIIKSVTTNTNVQESSYPSLFAFLKYSSATSTIIAKTVFETQSDAFVRLVNGLTSVFSDYNPVMDEETYNDFQKYIISSIDKECPSIKYPVTVRKNGDNIELAINEPKEDESNTLKARAETSRIFGYEHHGTLNRIIREPFTTADGKQRTKVRQEPIEINDLNNPTDEEIEAFETLSPAQKVQYIKTNFSNPGIFGMLNVSLYNPSLRGKFAGMQTIEYIEQNLNPNVVYSEFKKAFYNSNPLVVSAAIDLVKYAIQVEGMRMSARATNKVIDNDCLIEEFGPNGLGLIDFVKDTMANIGTNKSLWSTTKSLEELYENYLRSHPECTQIRTLNINSKTKSKYGIEKGDYGTYYFAKPVNEEDKPEVVEKRFNTKLKDMGIKYYLPITDTFGTNKYIRLREKGDSTLYKIVDKKDYVILYPLSNLESNENTTWSGKESNNQGILSKEAYELLIQDYESVHAEQAFKHDYISKRIEEYKKEGKAKTFWYERRKDYNYSVTAKEFNIERDADEPGTGMYNLKQTILKHFKSNFAGDLYVFSGVLSNYIFSPGPEFGSKQEITFGKGDKRTFIIQIPKNINQLAKYYLKDNNSADDVPNESFRQIIKNAKERKGKTLEDVFLITPYVKQEAYAASLEEVDSNAIEFMSSQRSAKDFQPAIEALEKLRVNSITAQEESIAKDIGLATREIAKFATHTAEYIRVKLFEQFIEDPDNPTFYLHITNPRIQAMIKEDEKLLNKYLEAINMATGFINTFSAFDDVNAKSDNKDIELYINNIKEAVEKVRKLPIADARDTFNHTIADKLSTNPEIKSGLIDVMDGYWRTQGSMWKFHDIMENGTPILQIILKDVMGDIEAKAKHQQKVKRDFLKKLENLEQEARRNGQPINWNNIVDKEGRLIRDFDNSFLDKISELVKTRDEAARQFGYGSIEHLRAKLAYDEFKAKHVNQEAKPEYYLERIALEKQMLDGYTYTDETGFFGTITRKGYPKLYERYMKLYYEKLDIYNYMSEDGIDETQRKRLNEIDQEIYNLYRPGVYYNGEELVQRPHREENISYTPEQEEELDMYGSEAALALQEFMGNIAELNMKYYQDEAAYGFEDQLRINLNIVESFEDRDANGIPQKPQDWLDAQPEYVAAKQWIANNARFKLFEHRDEKGRPTSVAAKIKDALKRLSIAGNAKNKVANEISKAHDEGKGIYDEHRIPDARKLSDEEIARIKEAQESAYGNTMAPRFGDRILISNARPKEAVFNQAFYDRLSSNREKSAQYYATVTKLNRILEKYYNNLDGVIHLEDIDDTDEGIEVLKEIAQLYQELRALKSTDVSENTENKQWIKDNVEFVTNETIWNAQVAQVRNKSSEFRDAWLKIAYELNADGSFKQIQGNFVPNRFLYSYAKPKGQPGESSYDKWVDSQRQEDINLIKQTYRRTPTRYYYQARNEAMRKAEDDPNYSYSDWYNANHVWNPYTRKMEPLDCWIISQVRDELFKDNTFEGRWVPRSNQKDRKVKDGKKTIVIAGEKIETYDKELDMRNENYIPDVGLAANYVKGSQQGEYDSKVVPTKYEREMRELIEKTLMSTATVDKAQRYFKKGYLPRRTKAATMDKKLLLNEFGKMFGFGIGTETGRKPWQTALGYEHDFTPDLPMTQLLKNKQSRDYEKELSKLKKDLRELDKESFNSEEEYNAKVAELENQIEEKNNKIKEINNDLLDRNWGSVIAEYLEQVGRYNAIQDNKQKLYHLLNTLRNAKTYTRKYGVSGSLKENDRKTSEENPVYDTAVDEQLVLQYENVLRRLLFDQWKEPEDNRTRIANALQGFTSANYMMLNVRGGIANVTLGETGILAEAAAKEYFGAKDWAFGTNEWRKGLIGYARRGFHSMLGEDRCFNKQDAIIQYFNVVDYDATTEVVRELSVQEYSEKLRNLMFSPQTIGEHFMQNSVLFAMLRSHKLVTMEDGKTTYMTEKDYVRYKSGEILETILSDKQKEEFAKFKKSIKQDKNVLKDYAWFRKDALTDFIYLHCTDEQIKEFIKKRNEHEKKLIEEYKEKLTMYDQLEMDEEGHLKFKDGSELAELDEHLATNASDITQAEALLGRFTEKVRKVNNKIHGVYNKDGRAYIERKWYGSLIMQYHKHLPMGILKRYMARGHWNELRESVDKGMLQSGIDMMRLNFRKLRVDAGLSDEEVGALEAFTFTLAHCLDYLAQLKTTWAILPAYERANIRRNLGDLIGTVGAMATVAALWYIADDDDDMQDSLWFNMALYEADRLASEAFMYNPIGALSEGKKLMSQPVAVQSIIEDAYKTVKGIFDWMLDDEYDPYYHSGRFAGESKLSVYIQRRIPIWNGIRGVLDTPTNNHYYKFGQNLIGIFDVKKRVTGD